MKILIVDDSAEKVDRIKLVIGETDAHDCSVHVAENNAEAISIIKKIKFDLVILDLNLPIRKEEFPKKEAGSLILKEIVGRATLKKPNYLIGLTAYSDTKEKVKRKFKENGWVILKYDPKYSDWEVVIKNKINYILTLDKNESKVDPEFLMSDEVCLIMKGGGIKGLSYIGALEILQKHYSFGWYVGTSAGAITALLLACGFTIPEMKKILYEKNFSDFKDASYLGILKNFYKEKGFFKAESFVDWMDDLLATKLQSTARVRLEDLPTRATIYASRNDKKAYIFDSFDEKSKENSAAFAARCSMSIPYVFTPQLIEGLLVMDGGLQNNFPVDVLIKEHPDINFIGLYLGSETYRKKSNSIFKNLESIFTESSDPELLRTYRDKIVVIDPEPISTLNFRLSEEQKDFLMEAGRLSALNFLHQIGNINKDEYKFSERKKEHEKVRTRLKMQKTKKWKRFKTSLIALILVIMILIIVL